MLLAALERFESLTGILATAHATLEDKLDDIISILHVIPLLSYVSPFDDWKEPQHKTYHGAATGPLLRDIIHVDDVPFDGNIDEEADTLKERSDARDYWNIDNGLYESIDQAARLWFGHFRPKLKADSLKKQRRRLQSDWPPQPAIAHLIAKNPNISKKKAIELIRLLYLAWRERDRMEDMLAMYTYI